MKTLKFGDYQEKLQIRFIRRLKPGNSVKTLILKRQIRRASVSILSNIAEGFERKSNKEFVQFLFIAKGSAGEVRSQLYLANDLGYLSENDFEELMNRLEIISKSLSGFIKYLRGS